MTKLMTGVCRLIWTVTVVLWCVGCGCSFQPPLCWCRDGLMMSFRTQSLSLFVLPLIIYEGGKKTESILSVKDRNVTQKLKCCCREDFHRYSWKHETFTSQSDGTSVGRRLQDSTFGTAGVKVSRRLKRHRLCWGILKNKDLIISFSS